MSNNKNAIVTTLKEPGPSLYSFLVYHFKIGFDHIFLFFDDADDPMMSVAAKFPNVTIVRKDDELKKRWTQTKSYKENAAYAGFIDIEVMARQIMNLDVAIEMALELNIDWLLHIDADELFFTREETVKDHFRRLSENGIDSITYINHEAIPEQIEVEDAFTEVTLFRRNAMTFGENEISYLESLPEKKHFLFYSNGKSAGRVSKSLQPFSVHTFKGHQDHNISSDPCILHYPVCGLSNFMNKYRILGAFGDKWFGVNDIKEFNSFHIESRNIMRYNDDELAKAFYIKRIMGKEEKVTSLIESKLYFRENYIQKVLRSHIEMV